jgi:hypothetical protein
MNRYSITDPRMNLPAGTYYIGDPCYVIKDEDWMQALNETNFFNLCASPEAVRKREFNPKNLRNGAFLYHAKDHDFHYHLAASSTKFGDGDYPCKNNGCEIGKCGVDAGLISAIPVEMIEIYGEESG